MVVAYVLLLFGGGLAPVLSGPFCQRSHTSGRSFRAVFTIPLVVPALTLFMIL